MRRSCRGVAEYIADRYDSAAEIGIGHFPDVALDLSGKGLRIFATDIRPFLHDGLPVHVDDISQPDLSLYDAVQVLYSIRPPVELVPYMRRVAGEVHADVIVKPLSSEYPLGGQLTGSGRTTFFLWRRR